jgi:hypothetical protein
MVVAERGQPQGHGAPGQAMLEGVPVEVAKVARVLRLDGDRPHHPPTKVQRQHDAGLGLRPQGRARVGGIEACASAPGQCARQGLAARRGALLLRIARDGLQTERVQCAAAVDLDGHAILDEERAPHPPCPLQLQRLDAPLELGSQMLARRGILGRRACTGRRRDGADLATFLGPRAGGRAAQVLEGSRRQVAPHAFGRDKMVLPFEVQPADRFARLVQDRLQRHAFGPAPDGTDDRSDALEVPIAHERRATDRLGVLHHAAPAGE